jgi:hypothetical protein
MYELPKAIPDVKMPSGAGAQTPAMENGQYGWLVLSRRAMESAADFKSFKAHGAIIRCPLTVQ